MDKPILINEFLRRKRVPVKIMPDQVYSLVTVKLHHKGVVLRETKKGALLGSSMYRVSAGDFILSGIDARNGAFGIVPLELDGAIVTNDFWYFDIDESKVKRDFFYWLTTTPLFLDICQRSSKGETQRIRLQRDLFLNSEFHFPPVEHQEEFLSLFQKIEKPHEALQGEFATQSALLTQLRQAILQEAIEGKLTADWRKTHPIQKGDPETDAEALLAKIKTEKQKLIADGKLKKEKPFPPISPDDTTFNLPKGWVWARLGVLSKKIGSGSTPKGSNYSSHGHPFFRSQNIYDTGLHYEDIKYISDDTQNKMQGTVVFPNDLLLNITGGSLGRCAIVPAQFADGNVSQHVCIIRIVEIAPQFAHKLVLSPYFQNFVFGSTTGAGREGLPKYNLEQFILPLPPLAEQRAIVERVEKLLSLVDQLEVQVTDRKSHADALLQTVLRDAFGRA